MFAFGKIAEDWAMWVLVEIEWAPVEVSIVVAVHTAGTWLKEGRGKLVGSTPGESTGALSLLLEGDDSVGV